MSEHPSVLNAAKYIASQDGCPIWESVYVPREQYLKYAREIIKSWIGDDPVYRVCDHAGQRRKMLGRLPLCDACHPSLGYLPLVVSDE